MILNLRLIFGFVLISVLNLSACAQAPAPISDCKPQDHALWTKLLQSHVDSTGWVSYRGFLEDSLKLNKYLAQLSTCAPANSWTESEKKAYWINVYNAFTVKLIVDHYPVVSIKDIKKGIPFINSVWEMDFFQIDGKDFDLSTVEHDILRKDFDEPRIHFAIVCASKSCPRLLNEAYEADKLEEQLMLQAKNFINDNLKNELQTEEIRISSIFKWFKKDFTKKTTLQEYLRQYATIDVGSAAAVKYLDYDWSLNGE